MPILSLSGGSGKSMSSLIQCPRKFKLEDEWEFIFTPIYFVEGNIFHDCAEKILKDELKIGVKEDGTLSGIDHVYEIYRTGKYFDEYKKEWRYFDIEELAGKKMTKAEQSIKRLPHQLLKLHLVKKEGGFGEIREIEKPLFLSELIDPRTGNPSDLDKKIADFGVEFAGRVDILTDAVEDLKTAKQPKAVNAEEQISMYSYMETIDRNELVDRGVTHIFSKHTTQCEYVRQDIHLTLQDHVDTYKDLQSAGKAYMKAVKEDFPRTGRFCNCREMYNQICKFHPICFPGKYEDAAPESHNLRRKDND